MNTLMTRQQLCAALSISESTVWRLESHGLPTIPVGIRAKRYDLEEVKSWLRLNEALLRERRETVKTTLKVSGGRDFLDASRRVRLRVMPSE